MLYRINNPAAPGTDLFALELNYNDDTGADAGAEAVEKSNGTINRLTHYAPGAGTFSQQFTYDGLSRLSTAQTTIAGKAYHADYDYDRRGNITHLTRQGQLDNGGYGLLDALNYTYAPNSNRLASITDDGDAGGYDPRGNGQSYVHDDYGNVTHDPSRGMNVKYNYLHLPYEFTHDGKVTRIVYSSMGQKLQELGGPKADIPRTYLGDFEFVAEQLAVVHHPKGRVEPKVLDEQSVGCDDTDVPDVPDQPGPGVGEDEKTDLGEYEGFLPKDRTVYEGGKTTTTAEIPATNPVAFTAEGMVELQPGFKSPPGTNMLAKAQPCRETVTRQYEYYLKDHLGNIRVRFADQDLDGAVAVGEVLGEHHYYGFGMEMGGGWNGGDDEARHRFNSIERNESLGLDLAPFRSYDPTMGRWLQVDPLTEVVPSMTSYRFGFNNPNSFSDPLGLIEKETKGARKRRRSIKRNKRRRARAKRRAERRSDRIDRRNARTLRRRARKEQNPVWSNFNKSDLNTYAQSVGICSPCTSNELGAVFEDLFEIVWRSDLGFAATAANFRRERQIWNLGGNRNTMPDFTSDGAYVRIGFFGSESVTRVLRGSAYEVKAYSRGVYLSSNTYQLKGHIDDLVARHAVARARGYIPQLVLITTADVPYSRSVQAYANARKVAYIHLYMQYQVINGVYQFRLQVKL